MTTSTRNLFAKKLKGFSLLETVLALATVTIGLSALWTLVMGVQQTAQDKVMAQQMLIVGRATQAYINTNAMLLMPLLPAVGDTLQIRVRDADTGSGAAASLVGAGFLPSGFMNSFALGQTYTVHVMREDAGAAGPTSDDLLVGLVVTTGGQALTDKQGARIAGLIGPSGGFVYSGSTTQAEGAYGGWSLDLSSWSLSPGSGQLALLTKLADEGVGSRGGGGASAFDDLSDSKASSAYGMFFLGDHAGDANSAIAMTGIGYQAVRNLGTTGTTAVGAYALATQFFGNSNTTAVGTYALQSAQNTTKWNLAIGLKAGKSLKGSSSVLVGAKAGENLSATASNFESIALGYNTYSGSVSTTAASRNNIFIGSGVQSAATTIANSIIIGKDAATTAVDNTYQLAIGSQAAYSKRRTNSTWVNQYIAIGSRAFYSTVGGMASTVKGIAIGESAAYLGTGYTIRAIGAQALANSAANSGTVENTGIGFGAGYNNTSAAAGAINIGYKTSYAQAVSASAMSSVHIGASANETIGSVSTSVLIGAQAKTMRDAVVIGSQAQSLETPTSTMVTLAGYKTAYAPAAADLSSSVLIGSQVVSATSASSAALGKLTVAGYQALYKYANYNISAMPSIFAAGWRALADLENPATSSSGSIAIGKSAGYVTSAAPVMAANASGSNLILIGADISTPTTSTSNYMMLSTAIRTDLSSLHSVIGGTGNELPFAAGSPDLYVAGNMQARNYFYPSDKRLKTDIQPLQNSDRVLRLRPVSFTWKDKDQSRSMGFIAQELYEVFPELVDTTASEQWGVDYCSLTAPAIAMAQRQTDKLLDLEKKQQALLTRQEKLRKEVLKRLALRATESDLALLRAELHRVTQGGAQ